MLREREKGEKQGKERLKIGGEGKGERKKKENNGCECG